MLSVRQLTILFLLCGVQYTARAQQVADVKSGQATARARILHEHYCRGDADLFSISLKLEVEVANTSNSTVYLVWPMVPWVGRVAQTVKDAESGHFLYVQTGSHYPQSAAHFDRLKIEPGRKISVQSGYDLIARRDPASSIPSTVSSGTYALILVLSPEEVPPSEVLGPGTLQSITTDPFVVRVPSNPKLAVCEGEGKAR